MAAVAACTVVINLADAAEARGERLRSPDAFEVVTRCLSAMQHSPAVVSTACAALAFLLRDPDAPALMDPHVKPRELAEKLESCLRAMETKLTAGTGDGAATAPDCPDCPAADSIAGASVTAEDGAALGRVAVVAAEDGMPAAAASSAGHPADQELLTVQSAVANCAEALTLLAPLLAHVGSESSSSVMSGTA